MTPVSAPDPADVDELRRSGEPPKTGGGDRLFMVLLTVFEIGASILIVNLVMGRGGSDFAAYMWALLPPVIGAVIIWLRTRELSGMSMAVLSFNALSALVAFFGSHDSKVLLYKDCAVTGIIGLLFAGSLLFGKPLTYWFGQRFATGGTPEGLAWWQGLWDRYPLFRRSQRQICAVWAVIMWLEAIVKAVVIHDNAFANAYALTQVIPLVATGIGIAFTIWMSMRTAKAGKARAAAAAERDAASQPDRAAV